MKIDKENRTGVINMSSGHALIMGHKPKKLAVQAISDKLTTEPNTEVASFGLFDTASPNYATYYPDVTEDDLKPLDAEFIYPVFRMLSETIVYKGAPIDFGKPGVLKGSMKKLLGQTINIDHEVAIGNSIGAVSEVYWQESYKSKDGVKVPAGINAVLKIDGKSNPRIARGVMMEPPSIHSNSVTVRFKWEPSHSFDEQDEFYNKLGTFDKKGEMIRLVVTDITLYNETSLVSHGADPFAQRVNKDGEINNPGYANGAYSFSASPGAPINGYSAIDYKTDLSLSFDTSIPKPTNNKHNNYNPDEPMKELIQKFAEELEFGADELTEENLVEKVKAKLTASDNTEQITKLEGDKTALEEKLTAEKTKNSDLSTELANAKADSEALTTVTKNTREEAVRLYKLTKGDDAEENIINLISEANLETANSFLKQYRKEADQKFEATCNDCKSTNVSRASAQTSKAGLANDEGGSGRTTPKGATEVRNSVRNKKKRKSIFLNGNK